MEFSFRNRPAIFQRFTSQQYDLVVIGGGITGAGIALDASVRGLKTALVEKHDFAFGTSSRSTKLIHGGLRYLKQLEFGLVKEVGSERAIVHALAPHLVVAEKMLLPLNEGRGFGSLLTSFGLRLYDWLAGVKPEDQRKMLTRKQTLHAEPLLKPDDIKGSGLYAEYRTDDARLTTEIIKTAVHHKADILNYCEAGGFTYEDGKLVGVQVCDWVTGTRTNIQATAIVNATGPWVDEMREADHSKKGKELHLTKGVHVVVPYDKLPLRQAIYFDVTDGRMVFAIPRGRITYIGTTDTEYNGSKENVVATRDDALYLLKAVNETFPSVNLRLADIESSWAGLRPLIHEEGKSASELSRRDEIFISDSGLISIAGGKLTGYRKMAERVVDLAVKRNFEQRNVPGCTTDKVKLAGSDFRNAKAVKEYTDQIAKRLHTFGLQAWAAYLVSTYGSNTELILDRLHSYDQKNQVTLTLSELRYTIEYEMVLSAVDFFVRRTGMVFFYIHRLQEFMEPVLSECQSVFGWSNEKRNQEKLKIESALAEATSFKTA